MFKFIFTKWKQIGKYNNYFAISVNFTDWALPINLAFANKHLRLKILFLCFVLDMYDISCCHDMNAQDEM